jgi:hypothetical protein
MFNRQLLQREWAAFRRPGRLVALALVAVAVIGLGLLPAFGIRSSCPGPCPIAPTAADGSTVADRFWFVHRDLGAEGSITVRLTDMTGTITYPPPDHDEIVSGLVSWAKTGIIIKDGTEQGSTYAAVMMTGEHGVRMQHDYRHDVAGSLGRATPGSPLWLRLTRDGDDITGYESADGERWTVIGTVTLDHLPDTAQVGLFATSPGDLTLDPVALGGAVETVRFTQAGGVFDRVSLEGAADGEWRSEAVGQMNQTDWEKDHQASGSTETGGEIVVTGTGDIGPLSDEGFNLLRLLLLGLPIGLIVLVVVAARWGARTTATESRETLAARATVLAAASFPTVLVAVGAAVLGGQAILRLHDVPVPHLTFLTGTRVIVGLAAVTALCTVLAYLLGALLRRGWAAIVVGLLLTAIPYVVATNPLLPDEVDRWILRLTPAAAFAVQQTGVEYAQVVAHFAPSNGYFPLPAWAGLAVLGAYLVVAWWAASRALPEGRAMDWR